MSQPVGLVTKVSGESYAVSGEKTRFLAVGSSFFASDVLVTQAGASLELVFYDESVVSLGASSRIEVKEFVFDAEQQVAPSFVLHMLEGVVRSVSGKVVEQNPEGFKLSSPLATISIRGTETLHIISPTNEIHSVVSLGAGHTVVLNTPDGRAIVISDSLQGLKLAIDDLSPLQLINISPELLDEYIHKLYSEGSAQINPQGVFVFADAEFLNSIANVGFITNSLGFLAIEQLDNLLSAFDLENSSAVDLVGELFTGDALMVRFLESNTLDLIESPQIDPDQIIPDPIEPDPIVPDPPLAPAPPGQLISQNDLTGLLYGDTNANMNTHGASDTIMITGTISGFGTVLSGDAIGNISGAGVIGGNDSISVESMTAGGVYGDAGGEINTGARGGNDTITVNMMSNWGTEVSGDAQIIRDTSFGGNDVINIEGAMTSTSVYGDAVEMFDSSLGGNDTLMITGYFVNSGTKVFGDSWNMNNSSRGGNDYMSAGYMDNGAVVGDANTMADSSIGGNDIIDVQVMLGGIVYGDAYDMGADTTAGNDSITIGSLYGGTVYGDAGLLYATVAGGHDTIEIERMNTGMVLGGVGNDSIKIDDMSTGIASGSTGNDTIRIGSISDSSVYGGAGDDTIIVDLVSSGVNNLYGGASVAAAGDGNDTFVFKGTNGSATITIKDFGSNLENTDILNFHTGWTNVTNAQSGADWQITAISGAGTLTVVLEGLASFNSAQLIL